MSVNKNFKWRVLAHSVRGASHERDGLPNQDALAAHIETENTTPLVLAVSDGHGSAKSFRSHIGSACAVAVAKQECLSFLAGMAAANPSVVKSDAEQRLPAHIVHKWTAAVREHFEEHPVSDTERQKLISAGVKLPELLDTLKHAPQLAYGATLLVATLTEAYAICMQLGDGDIITVSADGTTARPIDRDPSLLANETTSLCMDSAWRLFKTRFQYIRAIPPALFLLSTDGYYNSFSSDADFLKVGPDLLTLLKTEGPDTVDRNLPEWLAESSSGGSGDDVTLAIAYRLDNGSVATHAGLATKTEQLEPKAEITQRAPAQSSRPSASPAANPWWKRFQSSSQNGGS